MSFSFLHWFDGCFPASAPNGLAKRVGLRERRLAVEPLEVRALLSVGSLNGDTGDHLWNYRSAGADRDHDCGPYLRPWVGNDPAHGELVGRGDPFRWGATGQQGDGFSQGHGKDGNAHAWTYVYMSPERPPEERQLWIGGGGGCRAAWFLHGPGESPPDQFHNPRNFNTSVTLLPGWSRIDATSYHQHEDWNWRIGALAGMVDVMSHEPINLPPEVDAAGDQAADEGESTSLALGSFSDPDADAPWLVQVDWGDRSDNDTFTVDEPGTLDSRSHTYAFDGSLDSREHTVTVTVTENNGTGASDSGAFNVTVSNVEGEIRGSKFNDLDGDGEWDDGEPGLDGWTINLDADCDGVWDDSTQTDGDGNYSFAGVAPGTYVVAEQLQPGWAQTFPGRSDSPEFQVNDPQTQQNQDYARVARAAGGSFVVVWQSDGQDEDDNGTNDYGIYGQRYYANGTPHGGPFQVNSHLVGDQQHPAVEMNDDGSFVVVWESRHGQDGDDSGIFAQRYDVDGQPAGIEFQVNTHSDNRQTSPSVAADAAGNFIVAWDSKNQVHESSGEDVFARRFGPNGDPLISDTNLDGVIDAGDTNEEFPVNEYTNGLQGGPSVVVSPAGNFVVSWSSYSHQGGIPYDIYARRYNPDGTATDGEFRANTETEDYQTGRGLAIDANGNFVIAWGSKHQDGDGWGVYAQRYDAQGNPLPGFDPDGSQTPGEFRVNTFTGDFQHVPSVAMHADGRFVVTWESRNQAGAGWGVYAQRYNADGTPQGCEFRVSQGVTPAEDTAYSSSVAMDANGNFVVAWTSDHRDGNGSGRDVFARLFTALNVHVVHLDPGEIVENINFGNHANWDFGDAPDDPDDDNDYPTLLVENGARHAIVPGFHLGATVDAEPDGQPSRAANGDDLSGIDDEDGVILTTQLIRGGEAEVDVQLVAPPEWGGLLDVWIDFNRDGDWADDGEKVFDNERLDPGVNTLSFTVPADARPGLTYARFRLSSTRDLPFGGPADDGEVEDYRVTIRGGWFVAYAGSAFDGKDPADGKVSDAAIATDKKALLPGETATFANYSSYSRGINSMKIDVPRGDKIATAADFAFRVGNDDNPARWDPAPDPSDVTVESGGGVGGSDRVTILWEDDHAIKNQWLQVTVLAANTGLAADDVFYFGNAVGESGNSPTDAKANAFDMLGARDNQRSFLDPAPIDFRFDYNRDARVDATDMLIARENQTHFLNALRLISVPGAKAAADAGKIESLPAHRAVLRQVGLREPVPAGSSIGKLDWLYEFEQIQSGHRSARGRQLVEAAVDAWWTADGL